MEQIKFTEFLIQKALFRNFRSHRFRFTNVYFFENESDFLSFLPSGYCYEFEIKISRSDFKADFKKIKHTIHQENEKGKKYYTVKGSEVKNRDPSWKFCKDFPELVTAIERSGYGYRMRNQIITHLSFSAYSSVSFHQYSAEKLPNKFFYVVPKGLVSADEIPSYAGLIYIDEDLNVKKIKDGKFIHKQILNPQKLWNRVYAVYESSLINRFYKK